jgi:plasmid stabilization system protein ParE
VAKIAWTLEAQRWLEEIYEFIAADNRQAAAETVQGIYNKAQLLIDHPEIGYRYWASKRNVRILLYGHFRIAYLIKDSGDVDVLGVFHAALDISRYQL